MTSSANKTADSHLQTKLQIVLDEEHLVEHSKYFPRIIQIQQDQDISGNLKGCVLIK